MKKLISENRWKLIWSTILLLIPQAAAAFIGETIYWVPLQCLALHWICLLITFRDWRKRPQGRKTVNLVIWICPVLSIWASTFVLLFREKEVSEDIAMVILYLGFGLMFLLIGNYFPKIRQNRTMGIKIKWALEDEENWNATHRFGGKVWVVCGFACMLCALAPFSPISTGIFIAAIAASVIIPTVYSWKFYQKRLRAGQVSESRTSRRSIIIIAVLIGATVVFCVWTLLTGNITMSYQNDGFAIQASGWDDYEASYDEIEQITYEKDGIPDGENDRRTNGFENLKMSMGEFRNDSYGDYIRYTFNDCPSCIVLKIAGETVVINGETRKATEEIFRTLVKKSGPYAEGLQNSF